MLKYLILLFILTILIYFLRKSESFSLTPSEYFLKKLEIEENIIKSKEYKNYFNNINKKYNFKIGYSNLESTNPKSIGFCYPGKYLNTQKKNEKCDDCKSCNKGYYVKEGCVGDSDAVCEKGKVPYEIYIEGHTPKSLLHKVINPHKHKYKKYLEKKKIYGPPAETNTNHFHI
tara:strand:- start:2535 stop:3053 length:519 start_codon:yes stop_codon:yes gene_type:complete